MIQFERNTNTREGIITQMCLTWDHAFLAPVQDVLGAEFGYTDEERTVIWQRMAQIFDNDIYPYMKFRK